MIILSEINDELYILGNVDFGPLMQTHRKNLVEVIQTRFPL